MVGVWYETGTGVVLEWYERGTEWYESGTRVVREWYESGTRAIREWYERLPSPVTPVLNEALRMPSDSGLL